MGSMYLGCVSPLRHISDRVSPGQAPIWPCTGCCLQLLELTGVSDDQTRPAVRTPRGWVIGSRILRLRIACGWGSEASSALGRSHAALVRLRRR